LIKVESGNLIPTDGIVVKGTGSVNESTLTGESTLVTKHIENDVYGGTLLINGQLIIRVSKTVENSSISEIITLIQSSTKIPI